MVGLPVLLRRGRHGGPAGELRCQLCGLCGGAGPGRGGPGLGVPGIRRRGGDHPPPGGQAELHSAASGAAGAAGSAGPPGREGLCPHYRRRRRELVLKPDRGREGGRHCGPHLRDGL